MGEVSDQDRDSIERSTTRRVHRRIFYIHAAVFVVVMTMLYAINYLNRQYGAEWWILWPLIGWGGGLAIHAFFTFFLGAGHREGA